MKTILVTGGAGYIGSAAVKALAQSCRVIVIDNLSKGQKRLVDRRARFIRADLADRQSLSQAFDERIDAVMHFAAYKAVGERMADAKKYSDNITGTINLLNLMVEKGVKKIIYSSSAAVYAMPETGIISENDPTGPSSFYGYTKLASEQLISWYGRVHGIKAVLLRYFNVAGDAGLSYIDPAPQNILPIIMEAVVGKREKLTIFGNDYKTPDGTCVRDYIDVNDLVRAHLLALDSDFQGAVNLGTSNGVSVKQLVDAAMEVTGVNFSVEYGPRRAGDVDMLVASNSLAKKALGWKPQVGIKEMIRTTYEAYARPV